MTETQLQLERLRTLQESFNELADGLPAIQGTNTNATLTAIYGAIAEITSRTAIYDATTGSLTLENVQLTINE